MTGKYNSKRHLSIVENQTLVITLPNGEKITVDFSAMDTLKDQVYIGRINEKGEYDRANLGKSPAKFQTQIALAGSNFTVERRDE